MANPYRGVFNARRVKNSEYRVFGTSWAPANRFADAARAAGFSDVRVTRFRSGSNARRDYSYRVTVYWMDGDAPDMAAFMRAANEME